MSLFTQGRVRRYNLWPNDWYACFPKPPEAKQVPSVRTFHGDTFTDPYEWMRDKDSADLKSYVAAENAYTSARTAGLANLRKTLFDEFRSHVQETDMSCPRDWTATGTTHARRGQAVRRAVPHADPRRGRLDAARD